MTQEDLTAEASDINKATEVSDANDFPEVLEVQESSVNEVDEVSDGGVPNIVASADHKYLGRLWMIAAIAFGIFTFVCGVILGFVTRNGGIFESAARQSAIFSVYQVGLIFLFLVPLLIGLAIYIVPRQIGADSLVFPRAGFGAFWGWLVGGVLFIVAWGINGGIAPGGSQEAVELSLLALAFIVVSILVATLSLVSTIVVSRIQNMTLWQVPFFTWSILVAGGVWLLSLPILLGNIMTAWVDLRGTSAVLYGSSENLYSQIDWVFHQPQVFVFAVPLLGIFADIVVASQGKRPKHYEAFQLLIALIAILSFGGYAQEFFSPNVTKTPIFVIGMVLLLLASLAFMGGWLKYAAGHKLNVPIILATLGMLAFFMALGVGVLRVLGNFIHFFSNFNTGSESYQNGIQDFVEPLVDLNGTVISAAVLHLVVVAGFLGALAGIHYWAPKIIGKQLKALPGIGIALSALGGVTFLAIGDIVSGFLGLPQNPLGLERFTITVGIERASVLNIIGALGVAVALVAMALETIRVFAKKDEAVIENPMNAPTLEWAEENTEIDLVTNAYPLWGSQE